MIGLYAIVNCINNKAYVGSSYDIEKRLATHKTQLNKGNHHNKHLLSAWKKYGSDNFNFKVIKICKTEKESAELEQAFLECFYGSSLYNIKNEAFGVGSGRSHPNKGKSLSKNHKQKISNALKKIKKEKHSKKTIEKISKNRSKYIVTTPDGIFYGFANAGRFYGISEVAAKKRCKNIKFNWSYESF